MLTKTQKAIIKLINNPDYTVERIEKYYKANFDHTTKDYSFFVMMKNKVTAYMTAVEGIEKVIDVPTTTEGENGGLGGDDIAPGGTPSGAPEREQNGSKNKKRGVQNK